jgi:PAS domain S-box-containing protein
MHGWHIKPELWQQFLALLVQPAARAAHRIRDVTTHDPSSRNLFMAQLEAAWKKGRARRYAASAMAVAAAVLTSLLLRPVFQRNPFLFYYAAVMFSAWYGGLGCGLVATGAAATAAAFLFLMRFPAPSPLPDEFAAVGLFIAVGIVTSVLSESLRKSERASRSLFRGQEFLAEATRVFSSSFDYDTRVSAIAETCVPALADSCEVWLADSCEVWLADSEDRFRPAARAGMAAAAPVFPRPEEIAGVATLLDQRQPVLFSEVDDSVLRAWTSEPERLRALRQQQVSSAMVVPLVSGERLLGAITLACRGPDRQYTPADLAFAERLAQRAALALDNALLYRNAQAELGERERVEGELRTQHDRLALALRQQATVARLGQSAMAVWADEHSLSELMDEVARSVAATLEVQYCKILELLPGGEEFLLRAGVGWKPGVVGAARVPAGKDFQAGYTLAAGQPVIVRDVSTETRFTAPPLLTEHGVVSGISVVIHGQDGPYGVLGAHSRVPHAFSEDDLHFIGTIATLLAAAIQRQRSLEQLRQSEGQFRTLAEAMPQMVWSTRPDGWVDYLSESWRSYTGQRADESLGYNGWKLALHPDDREAVLQRWTQSLQSGQIYEVDCRLRGADGNYRWILARGVPLRDGNGAITKWIGTCTDVHDRKLSEERLRTAEKLAATGRLVSTMAHEINNPLEALTNLVYLLANDPVFANSSAAKYLETAGQELARVNHVVNQTMGLFQGSTVPSRVSLPQAADDVLELYSTKIQAKDIRVLREYAAVEDLYALEGEVRQVLASLVANAIDASEREGMIRVRIHHGRDWGAGGRRGARIIVSDRGCGIEPENRARVFTPFFSTKSGMGTGLALWAIRELVRKRGGSIRFRSSTRPGASGTAFSVFVPAEAGQESSRMQAAR